MAALADGAFVKRMNDLAIEVIADPTPESARVFLVSETRRWEDVVKASGIKPEE